MTTFSEPKLPFLFLIEITSKMPQRYAVIDLGTNTFHLLIAELDGNKMHQLYAEKIGVRLGKPDHEVASDQPQRLSGISAGVIAPTAIERAMAAMHSFVAKMAEFGLSPSSVQAFGTSAMRNAQNGQAVAQRIQDETGIAVSIIDGEREADLIYNGVRHSYALPPIPSLIMDIGGGSVEFIIANADGALWQQSFEVGGQRLMDLFMQQDPIGPGQVAALEAWLEKNLQALWQAADLYQPDTLIGSAGTFETLADMCFFKLQSEHHPFEDSSWEELPLSTVYILAQELSYLNKAERLAVPGMIELRADMSVVAMLMLRYVLQRLGLKRLLASVYALKEGVFFQLADQLG